MIFCTMSDVCVMILGGIISCRNGKRPVFIQHMHTHMHTCIHKQIKEHALHQKNYAHTVILGKIQNQQTALKWNVQQKELHLM